MQRPAWFQLDPRQPLRLGPREIPGRVWTASGCFGYGLDALDIADGEGRSPRDGLGAVVTKTLTALSRRGNPMPRLRELPWGALNSIGLENVGLDAFLQRLLPRLAEAKLPFLVSLAAVRPAEFADLAGRVAESARGVDGWHGIELNLSCPNVAEGGHDFGSDPQTVAACVRAARPALPDRALLAKLTPNTARIAPLAAAAREAGADAVTAINTLVGLEVDLRTGRPSLPRRTGGYSGPGIRPVALAKVDEIRREVEVPVVGVGGIEDPEDALRFFALGVVAVQVGTAQMRDPFAAADLARALAGAGRG